MAEHRKIVVGVEEVAAVYGQMERRRVAVADHAAMNGTVAGRASELVFNDTESKMYLCVTSGAAGAAVWEKITSAAV